MWIIASSFVLFWIIFILTSTICPSVHTGLVVADGTEHKKKVESGAVACRILSSFVVLSLRGRAWGDGASLYGIISIV